MKISELIEELQTALDSFGDIEVVAHKNANYLDSLEKMVHLKVIRQTGPIDPRVSKEQRHAWLRDTQLQPNSGFISLPIPGVKNENLPEKSVKRVLYLGPKITIV